MMKLDREQIVKALECWASGNPCEGSCCPLFEISPDTCDRWIGRNSLSLIKELTQANEQLGESYEHLEKTKDELLAERSRLTEENERLRAEVSVKKKLLDKCVDLEDKVRADTVRAFAERLKKYYSNLIGNTFSTLVAFHIDEISKEMEAEYEQIN